MTDSLHPLGHDTNRLQGRAGMLWTIGLLCLVAAAAASGVLALKQFGVLDPSLPGCGPQSGCDKITSGAFGRIPLLDWPVSYLGLAYFIGMMTAWPLCLGGLSSTLRWIVRLGALLSFGWIIVMVLKGTLCPYCLAAHLGNFGFWIIVELSENRRDETRAFNDLLSWAIGMACITIIAAVGQQHRQGVLESIGEVAASENIAEIVQHTLEQDPQTPPGLSESGTPDATAAPQDTLAYLQGRWRYGPEDAPVQVVMFSDYQCPDCRSFETQIQNVLDSRTDVSLVVKHFPMCTDCNKYMPRNMHANACWAARTAETAGILGGEDRFWDMHHWLFDHGGIFPDNRLPRIVIDMGFDQQEFIKIMTSDETLDRVTRDIDEAKALGLFFTPMIFINGVELKWYNTPSRLDRTVIQIAEAIKAGREESGVIAPPIGTEKFVADWRENRMRRLSAAPRTAARSGVDPAAPDVSAWIDFTSPGCADVLELLRDWEADSGPVNLILHTNPMDHACNPDLPSKIKDRIGACMAAQAAKAAMLVGTNEQYWDMINWLIDNGSSIATGRAGQGELALAAAGMGMDPARFETSMRSAGVQALIDWDIGEFSRLGFRRIPSIVINGRELPRFRMDDEPVIDEVLDEAVRAKTEPTPTP